MKRSDVMERPKDRKCGAPTRSGKPCRNAAGFKTDHVGFGHCFLHFGNAPNHIKAAAKEEQAWRQRLAEGIDPMLKRLAQLAEQNKNLPVSATATRDWLDRAGVKADLTVTGEGEGMEVVIRWSG